jgi:hypothetical protein
MKRILFFAVLLCALHVAPVCAQTIIDDLQSQTDPSDGIIRITSDSTVTALIGKPSSRNSAHHPSGFLERSGYRIQVFMGGNPREARSEATVKQTAILSEFPELSAYLLYEAPNWRLLVGDFMTREEANIIKLRLQRQFPQFGKEMYIVADKVKIPVER